MSLTCVLDLEALCNWSPRQETRGNFLSQYEVKYGIVVYNRGLAESSFVTHHGCTYCPKLSGYSLDKDSPVHYKS